LPSYRHAISYYLSISALKSTYEVIILCIRTNNVIINTV
jgi:hypothetical protein